MTRGILIAGNESSLSSAIASETANRVEHFAVALIPNRFPAAADAQLLLTQAGPASQSALTSQAATTQAGGAQVGATQASATQAGGAQSAEAAQSVGASQPAGAVQPKATPQTGAASRAGLASQPAQIRLHWNPGSPVSARTLILAAENRLERIDDAILVCAPPSLRKYPTALTSTEVEIMVNDHIKGWFFLVKELSAVFKVKKAGTLALVLCEFGAKRNFLADTTESGPDLVGTTVIAAFKAFTQSLLDYADAEPFQVMGFTAPDVSDMSAFAAFIFKTIEEGNKRNNGKLHRFGKTGFNLFGR
jgi:hypothetical protein